MAVCWLGSAHAAALLWTRGELLRRSNATDHSKHRAKSHPAAQVHAQAHIIIILYNTHIGPLPFAHAKIILNYTSIGPRPFAHAIITLYYTYIGPQTFGNAIIILY